MSEKDAPNQGMSTREAIAQQGAREREHMAKMGKPISQSEAERRNRDALIRSEKLKERK